MTTAANAIINLSISILKIYLKTWVFILSNSSAVKVSASYNLGYYFDTSLSKINMSSEFIVTSTPDL